MYCGVDAQSKSVFEDEHEANVPQTKVALLDQTGKTIHTFSRLPFGSVLMIAVKTGRMKNRMREPQYLRGRLFPMMKSVPVSGRLVHIH